MHDEDTQRVEIEIPSHVLLVLRSKALSKGKDLRDGTELGKLIVEQIKEGLHATGDR